MSSNDKAQSNKRRRDNWTNMNSENQSRELKKKAEREALRKAGFTRKEHEKVMQQQRNAYYRRMSELSYDERKRLNERIRMRRRQQIRKIGVPEF